MQEVVILYNKISFSLFSASKNPFAKVSTPNRPKSQSPGGLLAQGGLAQAQAPSTGPSTPTRQVGIIDPKRYVEERSVHHSR